MVALQWVRELIKRFSGKNGTRDLHNVGIYITLNEYHIVELTVLAGHFVFKDPV